MSESESWSDAAEVRAVQSRSTKIKQWDRKMKRWQCSCRLFEPGAIPSLDSFQAPSEAAALHSFLCMLVAQSCLCDFLDCSSPGSSVHRVLQARILEWVAISFLQGIFPTQGSNLGLLHCRQILYYLRHQGSPHSFLCLLRR